MSDHDPQDLPKLGFKQAALIVVAVAWGYVVPWLSAQGAAIVDCWFKGETIPCKVHPDVVTAGACISAILAMFVAVIALEKRGYAAYLTFSAFAVSVLASIGAIVTVVEVGGRTLDVLAVPIFFYVVFLVGIFAPMLFFPLRAKWSELRQLYRMAIGTIAVGMVLGALLQFTGWLFWTRTLDLGGLLGNFVVAPSGVVIGCGLWAALSAFGKRRLESRTQWVWLGIFAAIALIVAIAYGLIFAVEYALASPLAAATLSCLLIFAPYASSALWAISGGINSTSVFALTGTALTCSFSAMIAIVLLKADLSLTAATCFIAVHGLAGALTYFSTTLGERTARLFGWQERLDEG